MAYHKLPGNTLSTESQLANFSTAQSLRFAIHDGRQASGHPAPLSMRACFYHPVFLKFLENHSNTALEIPPATVKAADKLVATVSAIHTEESDFLKVFERVFSELLGIEVGGIVNNDQTRPDGVYMFTGERLGRKFSTTLIIIEDKLQAGYSNAATQAILSFMHTVCNPEVSLCVSFIIP